jgi:hypothetical protein
MTWAKIPLWAKVAVPAVVGTFLLCNLIGQPKNGPNLQADSLAATRKAYAADTTRLLDAVAQLKAEADSQRLLKEAETAKWHDAETRAATARVSAAAARDGLRNARTVQDSLHAALRVIVEQDRILSEDSVALVAAHDAFGRLTAELRTTSRIADSLDAGWRRTRDRLALSETALAVEQRRTTCSINLVVTRVGCPSRGVVFVVGVVGGAVGYAVLRKGKS